MVVGRRRLRLAEESWYHLKLARTSFTPISSTCASWQSSGGLLNSSTDATIVYTPRGGEPRRPDRKRVQRTEDFCETASE